MRMHIRLLGFALLLLLSSAVFLAKQAPLPKNRQMTVAFYNLENLFDTADDPAINDEEYLPASKLKWDAARYQAKLQNLSKVISQIGDEDGPEILGVCEIENAAVLKDLAATPLLRRSDYQIVHFDSPDMRGIDVGLLYKKGVFRSLKAQSLRVTLPKADELTRDLLHVEATLPNKELIHLLVNHWPSRRGGAESEAKRIIAATVARRLVDSLRTADPAAKILLMGDFNDEPENLSIKEHLRANSAPDYARGELFNAFADQAAKGLGSHRYQGKWNQLDQIILSQGLLNAKKKSWKYVANSATAFQKDFMIQQEPERYRGEPLRTYAGERYLGGFSDHLPVYVHLTR